MSLFSYKPKTFGINKSNVVVFLILVATVFGGALLYVFNKEKPKGESFSTTKEAPRINEPTGDQSNTLDNIVKTGYVPHENSPTQSIKESANATSVPAIGLTNQSINPLGSNTVSQKSMYDTKANELIEQDRLLNLKNKLAAYRSKSVVQVKANSSKDASSPAVSASTQASAAPDNKKNASAPADDGIADKGTYLDSKLITPKSPYLVQAGSIIPAVMISGLNSDISGEVIAQVRENVYDSPTGAFLLIPQGSRLVGDFSNQIAYGQERVAVAWQRVIFPNGSSIALKGMKGSDVAGFSGFSDQVDNHYWKIFGSSFVMGVITAGMQYSQNNTNPNVQAGGLGFSNAPDVGQTLSGSLGQQLGQTALQITSKQLNVAPTIIVRQGYKFTIMLTADVQLKPYKD